LRRRWDSRAAARKRRIFQPDVRVALNNSNTYGESSLKHNRKVAYAISAALASAAQTAAYAADEDNANAGGIGEVVVTAQRRSESIQDVPITVQAITGAQLKQLNVVSFNDLLKYTPNVTFSGNGPGTGNIFIRGLGGVGSGNQSQSTTAPFPNVALYLDDQSMQFPARNVDVYLVDMERVEILEGPQGTLFGGGAQAGAVRYITNKPKLGVTEGAANGSYGITAGGDPNYSGNAVINLPFGDNIALRGVVFTEHQGGYITNVPSTIAVPPVTTATPGGPPIRPGSPPATNAGVQGNNLNTVQYGGARLSAAVKFNDDWDLLLQQNYQNFEADGYFYEYPIDGSGQVLGNHQIAAFTPAFSKDKYESTAWTLNGHVTDLLKVVYTGSYMVRNIDGQQDYSNYMRSGHGSYYACSGQGAGYAYFRSAKATTCYAPVGSWRDQVRNTHQSHEFRVSTNEDYRIRGLAGAYWEKFVIYDDMNFNYMPMPQCSPQNLAISLAGGPDCVTTVTTIPGYFAWHPGYRTNTNTAFGEDVLRGYRQTAFFGSIDIDIIPKVLTITGGTRHYKYDEFEHGSEYYSATSTVLNVPNGTCTHCGFGINLNKSESGFKSRANITWHITPDILTYYTWSQGFRPGGFNRTATSIDGSIIKLKGVAPFTAGGKDLQYNKPSGFDSDNLLNNEIGLKSEWFDHRVQFNASIYQMDWKNVQLPLFDPVHLGNTTFVVNGPTYRTRGIELQFIAKVFEGFTVQGSSSWNSSEQTNAPCLVSNRPAANNPTPLGQCVTQVKSKPYNNPFGELGTRAAFSPPWQFNIRGRYDWSFLGYDAFASVGASHVGPMSNEPASFPSGDDPAQNPPTTTLLRYEIPGYTTYDASLGASKDNWSVLLSGANLGNSDAVTNISSGQFIRSQIPLRPRVLTFNVGYKF
jgi:iron complex outermembrane recepter protein